jgi:hypothetical protein
MALPPTTPRAISPAGAPVSVLALMAGLAIANPTLAQDALVRVEENFRADPNGAILGQIAQGTRVTVEERQGNWSRATVRGFVWTPSVQARETTGPHGLVISVPDGENLRDEPAGRIAARLLDGTVLEEVERIPGWVEVRRTAWIWSASLDPISSAGASVPAGGGGGGTGVGDGASALGDAAAGGAGAPGAPTGDPAGDGTALGGDWLRGGSGGATILAAPDGDTLGRAGPGAELRILSQQGNWARVQLEGWVWAPSLEAGTGAQGDDPAVLTDVRAADHSREYDRFRGRLVELRLQYISLERAEQVRTDFREGEPFLLTRSLDEDRTFVYVAVPPERMDDVESLTPLESIRVLARVRAGAAVFTGSPILDLVELERIR